MTDNNEELRKKKFQKLLEAATTETGYKIAAVLVSKNYGVGGVALEPVLVMQKVDDWKNDELSNN